MQYFVTFLEGVISFISPCMLPMLPVYISYFAGDRAEKKRIFLHALFFVLGFTAVYCLMGLFFGSLNVFLQRNRLVVNLVTGGLVILFGLSYLEIIPLPFLKGMSKGRQVTGVFSAFFFGVAYSVSLTPCTGAFLGSALMQAANSQTAWTGVLLLLVYSLGLGIPFLLSAVLIDRLRSTFRWIKKHYRVINIISGAFLIVIGLLMALGVFQRLMLSLV